MTFNIFNKYCLAAISDISQFLQLSKVINDESLSLNYTDIPDNILNDNDFTQSSDKAKSFILKYLSIKLHDDWAEDVERKRNIDRIMVERIFRRFDEMESGSGFRYDHAALKNIEEYQKTKDTKRIPNFPKISLLRRITKKSNLEIENIFKSKKDKFNLNWAEIELVLQEYEENLKEAIQEKKFVEMHNLYVSIWQDLFTEAFGKNKTPQTILRDLNEQLNIVIRFANENKSTLMYSTCFVLMRDYLGNPLIDLSTLKSKLDLDLKNYLKLYPNDIMKANNFEEHSIDSEISSITFDKYSESFCWLHELGVVDLLQERIKKSNNGIASDTKLSKLLVSVSHGHLNKHFSGSDIELEKLKNNIAESYRKMLVVINAKANPSSSKTTKGNPFTKQNIDLIQSLKSKFGLK